MQHNITYYKTRQENTNQSIHCNTRQDKTRHDNITQHNTRQGNTIQHNIRQSKPRQDKST